MSAMPQLTYQDITDPVIRRNFQNLASFFQATGLAISGLDFMEIVFTKAVANYRLAHSLRVVPQDVLVTHLSGVGSVTFNYGLFDASILDITASGACRVRFLFGSLRVGSTNSAADEFQTFNPGG